jgi:hypothetical protein
LPALSGRAREAGMGPSGVASVTVSQAGISPRP